jgi:hypothetical protein
VSVFLAGRRRCAHSASSSPSCHWSERPGWRHRACDPRGSWQRKSQTVAAVVWPALSTTTTCCNLILPNLRDAVATKAGLRNLGPLWVPAMNINKVDPFKRNQHREQLAAEFH